MANHRSLRININALVYILIVTISLNGRLTVSILFQAEIKKTIEEVDNRAIATVCGSYRRGAKDSGDIDILMTHPDYSTKDNSAV